MEVKQYHGITYEEHHNLIFGDYVKISLRDWKYIQSFIEKYLTEEKGE